MALFITASQRPIRLDLLKLLLRLQLVYQTLPYFLPAKKTPSLITCSKISSYLISTIRARYHYPWPSFKTVESINLL